MNLFTRTEKIRFQHIDYAGIVFYPRFLEMLNALVEDWFEEALGNSFADMHETHGIPTVDLKVQFKRPARLGEVISKHLWVNQLKTSSVICGFRFENASNETCIEGEVTLVNVAIQTDRKSIKASPFDDNSIEKIKPFVAPKLNIEL